MIYPLFHQINKFLLSHMAFSIRDNIAPKYSYIVEQVKKELIPAQEWNILNIEEAESLGFQRWDEDDNLMLIPLHLYYAIPEGLKLTTISGREFEFTRENGDQESRCGCLAYGLNLEAAQTSLVYDPNYPDLIYIKNELGMLMLHGQYIEHEAWCEELVEYPFKGESQK